MGPSADDAFDTYSAVSVHVRRFSGAAAPAEKNRSADDGPSDIDESMPTRHRCLRWSPRRAITSAQPTRTTSSSVWTASSSPREPVDRRGQQPAREENRAQALAILARDQVRSALSITPKSTRPDLDDDGAALAAAGAHRRHTDAAAATLQFVDQVVTMRAPEAAMGWPRLQPLPEKFTSSSSMPYSRHAAIGTTANASLISHSVTSDGLSPARSEDLADHLHRAQPAVACRDTR